MKQLKKVIALVFALVFCLSATVMASAAENTVPGSILDFKPLQGDVNIDGYLNLKDLVRYKKYTVAYAGATIDEEVADFNADGNYNGSDLVGLQEAILNRLFQ